MNWNLECYYSQRLEIGHTKKKTKIAVLHPMVNDAAYYEISGQTTVGFGLLDVPDYNLQYMESMIELFIWLY